MFRLMVTTFLAFLIASPNYVPAVETEKPPAVPRLYGTYAPEAGAWSEYFILDNAKAKRTVLRLSILSDSGGSYWYEVVNRDGKNSNIVKMLVTGDPYDPENIQRIIIKSGINSAREMPKDFVLKSRRATGNMFERQSGIPTNTTLDLQNVKTGEEVLTVPAGAFDVEVHQIVDKGGTVHAVYKFSRQVRPFGIVASEAGNITVLLAGHGTGATSAITDELGMESQPPDMAPPQDQGSGPGSTIKQIPGMGTGYEPK